MADTVKEFVIDRSRWRCGGEAPLRRGKGPTQLLNEQGYSDVVGLIAMQLGCPAEVIKGKPNLEENDTFLKAAGLKDKETILINHYGYVQEPCRRLMMANDHEGLTDGEREERILTIFTDAKFKVTFTGQYQSPTKGG